VSASADKPVLIVTGPPGVGKTAAAWARAQARGREPLANPKVIERLWRDFADLGDLEPHAVEVGERSPEETADLLHGSWIREHSP